MNHPAGLRIAIDARYLSHGLVGGVHTYLRNLSSALLASGSPHRYVFWIDEKAPFELDGMHPALETRTIPWRSAASSMRNDLRIGAEMQRDGADLAHFPANYGLAPAGLPAIITIHDAINLLPISEILRGHSKQPKTVLTMTYLHLLTRRAVRQQPFVVTVSEYSRREILRHVDLDPDRVYVVHSAHEPLFRPGDPVDAAQLRCEHGLGERVILADAIKNPETTLEAFRRLPVDVRVRTSLVFFSRRALPASVQEAVDAREVTAFIRPPQAELIRLYQMADVFVFPSLYEGFGLPVLEAMACGTPVIASSSGSLPEVLGAAGTIVGPRDAEAIASAVTRLFTDPDLAERRRRESLLRAAEFSWERSARQMNEIYSEIHARSRATQPGRYAPVATG